VIDEGNDKRVDCYVHDWRVGHFNKKDQMRGGKLVDWESFWVDVEWIRTNVILLSFPILSNCKFSFHMHSLNRLGNFFLNPKWMIDDPEIIKGWTWRLTFNLDQLFFGISANMTHGYLTVVYEMEISQLPLSLDECCPLDWMPISLRVQTRSKLYLEDLLPSLHFDSLWV
jgi:hypothetical protein